MSREGLGRDGAPDPAIVVNGATSACVHEPAEPFDPDALNRLESGDNVLRSADQVARILSERVGLDDNRRGHLNLGKARSWNEWLDVAVGHAWVGCEDDGAADTFDRGPNGGGDVEVQRAEVVGRRVHMNVTGVESESERRRLVDMRVDEVVVEMRKGSGNCEAARNGGSDGEGEGLIHGFVDRTGRNGVEWVDLDCVQRMGSLVCGRIDRYSVFVFLQRAR